MTTALEQDASSLQDPLPFLPLCLSPSFNTLSGLIKNLLTPLIREGSPKCLAQEHSKMSLKRLLSGLWYPTPFILSWKPLTKSKVSFDNLCGHFAERKFPS